MSNVAILGTGLIGGSLGLALARAGGYEVGGYDLDPAASQTALDRGALTKRFTSPSEAAAGADVVVIAGPISATGALMAAVAPHVRSGAVVTDVGSAKADVMALGEETFGSAFLGGHPMAGSERHGIEAADALLFQDAAWILTPSARTPSQTYSAIAEIVTAVGAKPIGVEPALHDRLIARLSHVPQLAASAVVHMAAGAGDDASLLGLAGGGFRDVTRIAASNPEMWVAILKVNRQAVLDGLDNLDASLGDLRGMLEIGDWDGIGEFLSGARSARLELFAKPDHPAEPHTLSLLIPDRPGVLAEVTTAAGEIGANIEDLSIFHSTEGGRGRLDLVISGAPAAAALAERLETLGYHVDTGSPS